MKFQANQKVILNVAGLKFSRTVLEVRDGAVFLVEGGDAFDASTGVVWGGGNKSIKAD